MFRFQVEGHTVECDSATEMREALGSNGRVAKSPKSPKKNKRQGKGAKAFWAKVRKLSKDKGISIPEARAQLRKKK